MVSNNRYQTTEAKLNQSKQKIKEAKKCRNKKISKGTNTKVRKINERMKNVACEKDVICFAFSFAIIYIPRRNQLYLNEFSNDRENTI